MAYSVEIHKRVIRFFKKQNNPKLARRFSEAMRKIARDPFHVTTENVKKLKGYTSDYRLRLGDYRFIYTVQDDILLVLVYQGGPRGDVYKK